MAHSLMPEVLPGLARSGSHPAMLLNHTPGWCFISFETFDTRDCWTCALLGIFVAAATIWIAACETHTDHVFLLPQNLHVAALK